MRWNSVQDCETELDCIECDDDTRDAIITVMYNSQCSLNKAIFKLGMEDELSTDDEDDEDDCCPDGGIL
jgi:hypothetical protein